MVRIFLFLSALFAASLVNGQIKTSADLISIFETSPSSVEQTLTKYNFKLHTTTNNVVVYKSAYQDVYITFDNKGQIKEVLLRANLGYNLKSVEKGISSDCQLTTKEKKRKIYTGAKYRFTFVNNDSRYEVAVARK